MEETGIDATLAPGSLLAGRYRIVCKIGAGGYGAVLYGIARLTPGLQKRWKPKAREAALARSRQQQQMPISGAEVSMKGSHFLAYHILCKPDKAGGIYVDADADAVEGGAE